MNHYHLILFSSLLLLGACGHKKDQGHDEATIDPEAVARPLDSFKLTSSGGIQIENFCDSLSSFFQDYQKAYMPEAQYSEEPFSEKKKCGGGIETGEGRFFFQLNFGLKKDDSEIHLAAPVNIYFDDESGLFSIKANGLMKVEGTALSSLESAFLKDPSLTEKISEGLRDLDPTFLKWVNIDNKDLSIFGHSYSEFLSAVQSAFSEGTSPKISPSLTFSLQPITKSKGTVKFSEVAPEYFKTQAGSSDGATFLGCPDLQCLNNSEVSYSISLQTITFRSKAALGIEHAVSTSTYKEFSIIVQGFPGN